MAEDVVEAHDQTEKETFTEHFADHEQRAESAEFRQTKHHLEHELGLGCAYCLLDQLETLIDEGKLPADPGDMLLPSGVKAPTPWAWYLRKAGELGLYPKGDKPNESHHFACEWAHWPQANQFKTATLKEKVAAFFRWLYGKASQDDAYPLKVNLFAQMCDWYGLYAEGLAQGRPPIASPDDDRTQLILCPEHHRGEGLGIHHTPFPPYSAGLVTNDGEVVLEPPQGHHKVLPRSQFGDHVHPAPAPGGHHKT